MSKIRLQIRTIVKNKGVVQDLSSQDKTYSDLIARTQKIIDDGRISDLHERLMYLSSYYTWKNKHCLDPLTREEFKKVFRLSGYEPPEITEEKLTLFNEIHRTEPASYLNICETKTKEQIHDEIKILMKDIEWK